MYPEALACKSYLEIAETFLNRLQAQVEKVKAFRAARNVPYAVLGVDDCLPPSEESLQGKLIVLRPTSLAPEYRTADCQLGFAQGGWPGHVRALPEAVAAWLADHAALG